MLTSTISISFGPYLLSNKVEAGASKPVFVYSSFQLYLWLDKSIFVLLALSPLFIYLFMLSIVHVLLKLQANSAFNEFKVNIEFGIRGWNSMPSYDYLWNDFVTLSAIKLQNFATKVWTVFVLAIELCNLATQVCIDFWARRLAILNCGLQFLIQSFSVILLDFLVHVLSKLERYCILYVQIPTSPVE